VATAGYIVFKSQQQTEEKKDETAVEKPKDELAKAEPKGVSKEDSPKDLSGNPPKDLVELGKKNASTIPDPPPKFGADPKLAPPVAKLDPKIDLKIEPKDEPKVEPKIDKESSPPPLKESAIYRKTLQATGWVTIPKSPKVMVTGTGSFVDQEKRLFLTAYHVIEGATEANVYFPRYDDDGQPINIRDHYLQNERPVVGDVIVADAKRDLAVLRLRSLPAAVALMPLAAKGAGIADRIFTVGNPGVSGGLWAYTVGNVRQIVPKKFRMNNLQEVDAWILEAQFPINQGDSGGPVVNDRVELVGVNCSLSSKAQTFSNCIELREVKVVLEQARRR
jgi:S1-C subfamily serine protease